MKKCNIVPKFIKPFLWSYDTTAIDVERDKGRIITNVLNLGTEEAVKWLFATYPKKEIVEIVANPKPGEWNKKSINYWSLVFDISPREQTRVPAR
ncbi:MAG: hypothetical protein Q7S34_01235 [bacterium]|nr:hypothetical protein [bacterium]